MDNGYIHLLILAMNFFPLSLSLYPSQMSKLNVRKAHHKTQRITVFNLLHAIRINHKLTSQLF